MKTETLIILIGIIILLFLITKKVEARIPVKVPHIEVPITTEPTKLLFLEEEERI